MGKTEGKKPLGRTRRRREDLQEMGWGMGCIDLALDRDRWWELVNVVMNLRVPQIAGNFLTS